MGMKSMLTGNAHPRQFIVRDIDGGALLPWPGCRAASEMVGMRRCCCSTRRPPASHARAGIWSSRHSTRPPHHNCVHRLATERKAYRILAMEGVGSSSRGTQPTRCKEIASTLHSQLCSSTVRMAGSKVSPRFGVLGCFRSTQDSRRRERMRDREPVRDARLRLSSCG